MRPAFLKPGAGSAEFVSHFRSFSAFQRRLLPKSASSSAELPRRGRRTVSLRCLASCPPFFPELRGDSSTASLRSPLQAVAPVYGPGRITPGAEQRLTADRTDFHQGIPSDLHRYGLRGRPQARRTGIAPASCRLNLKLEAGSWRQDPDRSPNVSRETFVLFLTPSASQDPFLWRAGVRRHHLRFPFKRGAIEDRAVCTVPSHRAFSIPPGAPMPNVSRETFVLFSSAWTASFAAMTCALSSIRL